MCWKVSVLISLWKRIIFEQERHRASYKLQRSKITSQSAVLLAAKADRWAPIHNKVTASSLFQNSHTGKCPYSNGMNEFLRLSERLAPRSGQLFLRPDRPGKMHTFGFSWTVCLLLKLSQHIRIESWGTLASQRS